MTRAELAVCFTGVMSYDDAHLAAFAPNRDALIAHNQSWAEAWDGAGESALPQRRVAVVACMDARLPVYDILGLTRGECHMIRNAGGLVSDDVIRSLCLSQQALKTREVVLVHHTKCGLEGLIDDEFLDGLEAATGERPTWAPGGFSDPVESVQASIVRLRNSPFIEFADDISGFVFDVTTALLNPVEVA